MFQSILMFSVPDHLGQLFCVCSSFGAAWEVLVLRDLDLRDRRAETGSLFAMNSASPVIL